MSEFYCPLPFRQIYTDPSGVGACCLSTRLPISVPEWLQHPVLKTIQDQLLNNQIPQTCTRCRDDELQFNRSLRLDAVNDYNNTKFSDTNIDFVDFRSSNICNFKCRSCNPTFSHGILNEIKHNDRLRPFFYKTEEKKILTVDDNNKEWIKQNLSQIRRLMFTGGEPTVIPEVREIIQSIVDRQLDQIQLLITSNGSFEDEFWMRLTEKIKNIHWTISIDAVGDVAGIVRHGTNWTVVNRNAQWLAKNSNSLDINTVVTNLNIFQLDKIFKFGKELQENSKLPNGKHGDLGCRHQFFICTKPYHLAVDNLPPHLAVKVIPYLNECVKIGLDEEQLNTVTSLIDLFKKYEFDEQLWNKSEEYNNILDSIRNEDHWKLYEENS